MRAVIFDLFCTLVPGGTDAERQTSALRMGTELGIDAGAFALRYHEQYPARFRGEFGDLRSAIRAIAEMAQPGCSPSVEAIEAAVRVRTGQLRAWLQPTPQALATLDLLRREGWLIGLLSNCAKETEELWAETPLAAGFFDAVGLSSALGVSKPQPEAYLKVAAMLGVEPGECYFVGDGASNELNGAAAVGMSPIMVTELQADDHIHPWDGPRLTSVDEVPTLIRN